MASKAKGGDLTLDELTTAVLSEINRRGIRNIDFAKMVGVSPSTITEITKKTKSYSLKTYHKIAVACGFKNVFDFVGANNKTKAKVKTPPISAKNKKILKLIADIEKENLDLLTCVEDVLKKIHSFAMANPKKPWDGIERRRRPKAAN